MTTPNPTEAPSLIPCTDGIARSRAEMLEAAVLHYAHVAELAASMFTPEQREEFEARLREQTVAGQLPPLYRPA